MFALSAPLANKRIGMFNILLLEQRIMSLSMREHLRLRIATLSKLVPELLCLEISRSHMLRSGLYFAARLGELRVQHVAIP